MYSVVLFFIAYSIQATYFIMSLKKCLIECRDQHIIAISIANCCVSLTVPISLYHSYEHLSCFTKPRLQSQIVRVIWMVPVYSLEGLLSISYPEAVFFLQVAREWYEGFVIYSFMIYLLNFLTERYPDLSVVLAKKPPSIGHHKYPFCMLSPWIMGTDFLSKCKSGVFQYVLVRCTLTVVSVPGYLFGWYVEGVYSVRSLYSWMIAISCVSQMFALYSLFMFYHALHEEIYVLRPFAKFICIKIVVFFSWFQGVAIEVLVQLGHISALSEKGNDQSGHSVKEVAGGIQALLICMEMFLAAIAFYNSFPVSEFIPNILERDSLLRRRKSASLVPKSPRPIVYNASPVLMGGISRSNSPLNILSDSSASTDFDKRLEDIEAHEDDQLFMFPVVNRKLDLGGRREKNGNTGSRSYPIVSFWGNILQLIGGGEVIRRKTGDPYNDDDTMSDIADPRLDGIKDSLEVRVQQPSLKRDAILTPSIIRNEQNILLKSLTESRLSGTHTPNSVHPSKSYTTFEASANSLADESARNLRTQSSAAFKSPNRWRSGKDPLHQRSGDAVSRRLAQPTSSVGNFDDAESSVKFRQQTAESCHTRICNRFCCCCLRCPFGRNDLESLCGTISHFVKIFLSKFCDCDHSQAGLTYISSDNLPPNCLNAYGIYGTSLLLPALWTVLIPVELLQDFSEAGNVFWTSLLGLPRQLGKPCGL